MLLAEAVGVNAFPSRIARAIRSVAPDRTPNFAIERGTLYHCAIAAFHNEDNISLWKQGRDVYKSLRLLFSAFIGLQTPGHIALTFMVTHHAALLRNSNRIHVETPWVSSNNTRLRSRQGSSIREWSITTAPAIVCGCEHSGFNLLST